MKIEKMDIVVVGAPWRELTIVELTTDSGISGLGEVRMVNKTDTLVAAVQELGARYVIGMNPADMTKLAWNIQVAEYGLPGEVGQSALAAFDMACWDIMGKSLNVPVWKLLGGKFRNRIPAYANGWYQGDRDPEVIKHLAKAVVDKGYRALKIDPFGSASAEITRSERMRALAILESVREAVGPDVQIFLEMHGRFTGAAAMAVARDVADVEPSWLEEPVIPTDVTSLRQLRQSTHLPIASGERMHSAHELRPFLEEGLVDIYQIDLTHAGGITGLQQLIGWTNAYNTLLAPHNVCGPIGTAAALHFSVACPNFKILEHFNDFADPWVFDIVEGAPRVDSADGCFAVPTGPGLGVTLNREECEKHPRTGGRLALFKDGWEKRVAVETYTQPED
ncbi:MAG: mandelate racemase/muconate lactonizing enzyme family protein [Deltaproteobacteria bacterium]|nr:mandelate racemase/muconate lactonizing enzyme family protein [Deltaproteobacteria bacterium]